MATPFSFPFLALCVVIAVFYAARPAESVKAHEFKTCHESAFCRRQRAFLDFQKQFSTLAKKKKATYYVVDASTVALDPEKGHFHAELKRVMFGQELPSRWMLHVDSLVNQMTRIQIKDLNDTRPLFPLASYVLEDTPASVPFTLGSTLPASLDLQLPSSYLLRIHYKPFYMEGFLNNERVFVFNEQQGMHLETGQSPLTTSLLEQVQQEMVPSNHSSESLNLDSTHEVENITTTSTTPLLQLHKIFEDGAREETFRGFTDSKPYGPRSFGFDMHFPTSSHAYGLAEHATDMDLPATRGAKARYTEPYRLYNLDVFEYDLDSPMALYGSIPYLHMVSPQAMVGFLVLSASEMWVDLEREQGIQTHWMVESNPLDLFLWSANTPADLHATYLKLTGIPMLPPLYALGYHQSRWSKFSAEEVLEIDTQFDQHELPYDVFWLDIEHTDGKRYLTWHPTLFKDHARLLDQFKEKGRKIVTIVDPHIKSDPTYFVSSEAKALDVFVKSKDQQVFHGHCWPGDSNWIDFTQQKAVDLWVEFFGEKKNPQGMECLTWNDMNEPSVFSGPEITLPKDTLHGPYEHRDVHNLYGYLFHRATYLAHLKRKKEQVRPFILSRAFFLGTQRYGAVWTGDNMAKWSHLEASLPMLLSLSISGIHFCGADVGGFFGDPDPELLVRWYQAAALQPFFRAHAHIDAKPREPFLLNEETDAFATPPYRAWVRQALHLRAQFMPMLYTAFFHRLLPPMLPLFFEFPTDPRTYTQQDAFLVGRSGILVCPVTSRGQVEKTVYLPGSKPWYQWIEHVYPQFHAGVSHTLSAPLNVLPMFVQAGRMVVTRDRPRRTVTIALSDPLTLYVFLDPTMASAGHWVLDDGLSTHPGHLSVHMWYRQGMLTATLTSFSHYQVPRHLKIQQIVLIAHPSFPSPPLLGNLDPTQRICTVKEPGLYLHQNEWKLQIFPS